MQKTGAKFAFFSKKEEGKEKCRKSGAFVRERLEKSVKEERKKKRPSLVGMDEKELEKQDS